MFKLNFFIVVVQFFSASLFAEQITTNKFEDSSKIKIRWEGLNVFPSLHGDEYANYILSGVVAPETSVEIAGEVKVFYKGEVVDRLGSGFSAHRKTQDVADAVGAFELSLVLPKKTVHIPIKVTRGEQKSYYMLVLDLEEVNENLKNFAAVRLDWYNWEVKGGLGLTLFDYNQEDKDTDLDFSFNTSKFPSLNLGINYQLTSEHSFSFAMNSLPSSVVAPDGIVLSGDKNFNWLLIEIEYNLKFDQSRQKLFSRPLEWGVKAGLQAHQVSFLNQESVSVAEVGNTTLTNLSLGLFAEIDFVKYLFETYIRYQTPMLVSSGFFVNGNLNFDGSIGFRYSYRPQIDLGVYWFGQWLQNDIEYFNSKTQSWFNGSQKLFFSNLSFQLIYRY